MFFFILFLFITLQKEEIIQHHFLFFEKSSVSLCREKLFYDFSFIQNILFQVHSPKHEIDNHIKNKIRKKGFFLWQNVFLFLIRLIEIFLYAYSEQEKLFFT